MNLLSIMMEGNENKLREKINKQIQSFKDEGILIKEETSHQPSLISMKYSVKIESIDNYPIDDFINIFKYCLAYALCDYIQSYEEPNIIRRIINHEYYYFDISERVEIQNRVIQTLNSEGVYYCKEGNHRKNKILKELTNFLENNSQIHVNGFITFRLQDYILGLIEVVEKAVEEFLIDREYNEFIKLLKYFVDIQEAKIEEVNIILGEDRQYKIFDGKNNEIHNDDLENIALEITDHNINYEDLLISSLITIAPRKIFIHKGPLLWDEDIVTTIHRIFGDRVIMCRGCEWCNVNTRMKKE